MLYIGSKHFIWFRFHSHDRQQTTYQFFKRKIDDMPLRIQRWMLCLQIFNFRLQHVSGRDNQLADYFSRTPTDGNAPLSVAEQTVDTVCLVTQSLPPLSLQSIADTSATDSLILELKEAISTNWPAKYKTNVFYPMRNELSVSDDGRTVFFQVTYNSTGMLAEKGANTSS